MMFMRGMIHTFAALGVVWPSEIGYDVLDVCYRCVIVAPADPSLWGW